jgi:hypothetical protein
VSKVTGRIERDLWIVEEEEELPVLLFLFF